MFFGIWCMMLLRHNYIILYYITWCYIICDKVYSPIFYQRSFDPRSRVSYLAVLRIVEASLLDISTYRRKEDITETYLFAAVILLRISWNRLRTSIALNESLTISNETIDIQRSDTAEWSFLAIAGNSTISTINLAINILFRKSIPSLIQMA